MGILQDIAICTSFGHFVMARFWVLSAAVASLHLTTAAFPDCQNGPEILRSNAVCNISAPASERAAAIVSLMTIAEKINNTGKYGGGHL